MNDETTDRWEDRLRAMAGEFPYPPTPDVAQAVRRRLAAGAEGGREPRRRLARVAIVAAVVLVVTGGLLAVPQVRAAVLEVLNIGAIRILTGQPTNVPDTTPVVVPSLADLAGEMSLGEAQAEAGFPVRLPGYPPDLGPPDRVFSQQWGGPVVILVWFDPEQPDRVRLSLHQLGPGTYGEKFQPPVVVETSVNGRPALWTEGGYLLQLRNGQAEVRRLVGDHVLIWTEGAVTYRLETDVEMEEAIRIAESVQ